MDIEAVYGVDTEGNDLLCILRARAGRGCEDSNIYILQLGDVIYYFIVCQLSWFVLGTLATYNTSLFNNPITDYCTRPQKIMFILQKYEGESTYNKLFYEIKKDLFQTEKEFFSDELKKLITM